MSKLRLAGLILGVSLLQGASVLPALAAGRAHEATIDVVCGETSFTVDANAFEGQKAEVTAFYRATGGEGVCRLFDGESGELLYDPSNP